MLSSLSARNSRFQHGTYAAEGSVSIMASRSLTIGEKGAYGTQHDSQ
jgi:hypothetical protein